MSLTSVVDSSHGKSTKVSTYLRVTAFCDDPPRFFIYFSMTFLTFSGRFLFLIRSARSVLSLISSPTT